MEFTDPGYETLLYNCFYACKTRCKFAACLMAFSDQIQTFTRNSDLCDKTQGPNIWVVEPTVLVYS